MQEVDFQKQLEDVLIRSIAGCSELLSVDRLSGGASQETYRIEALVQGQPRSLAMRRSPGGEFLEPVPGHPGLPVEALLMQCAGDAGVPVPEVFYVLQESDQLGDGFIMQWLEGEALGARIVRSEKFAELRPQLAYECGRILAKIHSIDLQSTGLVEKLATIPPDEFIDQMWERYKLFESPQPMIDYTARWLKENVPSDFDLCLVHNDFRNGNFMVSPNEIVAVLDWEVAHIGDPMRDLGWICTNSWRFNSNKPVGGFGEYEDLFRGYEAVSGKSVDPEHVKFWEVFGSFWWAVGCLGFAEHYRTGPDRSVERPAVGRRTSECQVDCVNLLIPGPVQVIQADTADKNPDMPRADELLNSVTDFLRDEVMQETAGRTQFMARVAANSLDIVARELIVGGVAKAQELDRLTSFYNCSGDSGLQSLRWRLVEDLRSGKQSLNDKALQQHLRATVVNQVAIDQPKYSGLKNALH